MERRFRVGPIPARANRRQRDPDIRRWFRREPARVRELAIRGPEPAGLRRRDESMVGLPQQQSAGRPILRRVHRRRERLCDRGLG